jgi:uncharacterized membrane protein
MDPDALRDEVDEWVRDGVITDAQAEEILSRYEHEDDRRPRAVLVLSLVGSALVFAGVVLFLATNWEDLHWAARALVLLAGPALAYYGGSVASEYDAPRIAHALCVLGAILVGPSLFLFDDLFSLGIAVEWLLLAWTIVALPTGHVLRSRPGTGLGIGLMAAVVAVLSEPASPVPAVGLLGVGVFALGRLRSGRVPWTYRMGGVTLALGTLLVMTMLEGQFHQYDLGLTPVLAATAAGALAATGWLHQADEREAVEWSVIVLAALTLSTTVAVFAPETVPELLAFVSVHVAGLAGLVGTGYLGYRTRSRPLIDLVALGGLFQTLSFVEATVVSALSGAIALVVAGLVLLAAGVALERGRRTLLSRL